MSTFIHHLGLPLERTGSIFSLSQVVCFLALLGAPLLFRRTGLASGIMLTQLATAASLAGLACIHTAAPAAWAYWAYMAFQSMNEPGIYSLLMERSPEHERTASAFTFSVSAAAQGHRLSCCGGKQRPFWVLGNVRRYRGSRRAGSRPIPSTI